MRRRRTRVRMKSSEPKPSTSADGLSRSKSRNLISPPLHVKVVDACRNELVPGLAAVSRSDASRSDLAAPRAFSEISPEAAPENNFAKVGESAERASRSTREKSRFTRYEGTGAKSASNDAPIFPP